MELNTLARGEQVGREQADKPAGLDSGSGELASEEPTKECNLARQLCYWFHLGTRLRPHINGLRERLVEAELHAFKLLPLERQVSLVGAALPRLRRPRDTLNLQPPQLGAQINTSLSLSLSDGHQQPDAANSSAGNLYQLKTNLLEVSCPAAHSPRPISLSLPITQPSSIICGPVPFPVGSSWPGERAPGSSEALRPGRPAPSARHPAH